MRYVFDFDEDSGGGRELLGGKGIGLAEMTQLGIPVPAGFTVTTDACRAYMAAGGEVPDGLDREIEERIAALEERTGKRFGDPASPLLVSVRSGAAVSMPGMMDTILNLGLNDVAAEGLAASTGDARFALDSYRRLIQMYGEVVDGVDGHRFEQALSDLKAARGVDQDVDLSADDLRELVETFKGIYEESTGQPFPQDAVGAAAAGVPRGLRLVELAARAGLPAHVRHPGRPRHRRERRPDGLRQPRRDLRNRRLLHARPGDGREAAVRRVPLERAGRGRRLGDPDARADRGACARSCRRRSSSSSRRSSGSRRTTATCRTSSSRSRKGRLYLLQTRTGKRTAAAALRVAVEMVDEGLISRDEAVARIDPAQLDQLLHPMIDPSAEVEVATRGLNASPGAASGAIVLDADTAEERGKAGEDVILVRWETTPDDIHGLIHARGVLTAHGGMTSHAAVVARGMGKPCVAGCEGLSIDYKARHGEDRRARARARAT